MAMTRADAATFLASSLPELLSDAGLDNLDEAGDLKEPIDEALLLLGTAYSGLATATIADDRVFGFRRMLIWQARARIEAAIGDRPTSVSIGTPSVSKSWDRTARLKALEQARKDAEPFITGVGTGDWGSGTITLDYLEPVALA